jgi:hypothetical protein
MAGAIGVAQLGRWLLPPAKGLSEFSYFTNPRFRNNLRLPEIPPAGLSTIICVTHRL